MTVCDRRFHQHQQDRDGSHYYEYFFQIAASLSTF